MPESQSDIKPTQISTALAAIWKRNQPQILERLDLLDRAAAATPLAPTLQHDAAATAHKLAGTLGMFGFPQGTELARQLELELELPKPNQVRLLSLANHLRALLFPAT